MATWVIPGTVPGTWAEANAMLDSLSKVPFGLPALSRFGVRCQDLSLATPKRQTGLFVSIPDSRADVIRRVRGKFSARLQRSNAQSTSS